MKSKTGVIIMVAFIALVSFAYIANQTKQSQDPGSVIDSLRATPEPSQTGGIVDSPTGTPPGSVAAPPASPMTLTITSHKDGDTVGNSRVVIRGKTKPRAEVFVNDAETRSDANGNFSVTLTIDVGDNPIVVSANDEEGNVAETEFILNYNG